MLKRLASFAALGILVFPFLGWAEPEVFEASGRNAADIQATVDAFRTALGNLNPNQPQTFPDGRREINWDGVPDAFSAPNPFPPNFFNVNSPRGVVFFTPGTGFQVSADNDNPTNTPVEFGNFRPVVANHMATFSPQRLFTALNSTITEVLFFAAGTTQQATTNGFGVVFTDVDQVGSTRIEYFDIQGTLLFRQDVLPGPVNRESLSFLGVKFDTANVYLVRITSGSRTLEQRGLNNDNVTMDDFIYGEPQPLP
jgi:hypothetical protein